jgi:chromate transport protein ChrA
MEYGTIFGIIPVLLAVPSYWLYVRSIFAGKTVPHMYSWLIWALLAGIGFAGQVSANAGPGAWNTGVTTLACAIVFLFSVKYGERKLSHIDKVLLIVAAVAITLRLITGDYVLSILLTTAGALIGFSLTIKKSYTRPDQENTTTFLLNAARNLISLFALSSISFVTFFYPFCMMIANASVVGTILISKKQKRS